MASTTISKVICECGEEVGKYYLQKHKLTLKHLNKMKEMDKLINANQIQRQEKSKITISEAIRNKKARDELKSKRESKSKINIKTLQNVNLNLNPNVLNKLFQFYEITEQQKYFFINYIINTLTNSFGYKIKDSIILNILNLKEEEENKKWDNDFLKIIISFIIKIEKELHDIPYNQVFEKSINKNWSGGDNITFKYLVNYFNIKNNNLDNISIAKQSYDIFKKRYIGTSMRTKLISYIIEEGFTIL